MNPLIGLKELQKVHHSWPIPTQFLLNSSVVFLDGLLQDYVRITGACALPLEDMTVPPRAPGGTSSPARSPAAGSTLETCLQLCRAVRAARKGPAPVITVNFSPWYKNFPGRNASVTGAPEKMELEYYTQNLEALATALKAQTADDRIELGAILLDSEKFYFTPTGACLNGYCTPEYKADITRKHDLIFNATRLAFPNTSVRIELYNRGGVEKWDTFHSWRQNPAYTLDELTDAGCNSLSVSLYTFVEIWNMRDRMNHTVELALTRRANGERVAASVTPWVSIGAGNRRVANHTKMVEYDVCWDYEREYSWQMGNEINQGWFGDVERQDRYAAWRYAEVVCMYPSVFDVRGIAAGPGGKSTNLMQHFASYVRGANGLDGTAPDHDDIVMVSADLNKPLLPPSRDQEDTATAAKHCVTRECGRGEHSQQMDATCVLRCLTSTAALKTDDIAAPGIDIFRQMPRRHLRPSTGPKPGTITPPRSDASAMSAPARGG
jgi:hypothetical protein